jgi:hypothetical protein
MASRSVPLLFCLLLAVTSASAQAVNTANFTALGNALLALFTIVGSLGVAGGLIFAIFKFIGRDIGGALIGVVSAAGGAVVIGYATTWATTLTGVAP